MDLELAYTKIDNLCCFNFNESKYWQDEYGQWVNFFQAHSQTHDNNFCKDHNEMISALETIKKLVDLQKEIECPLEVFIKLLINQECYFKECETEIIKTKGTIDMNNIDFENKRFKVWYECIDGSNDYIFLFFKDYKKYWWLSK